MNLALIVPGGVDRSGREQVIPALMWLIERLARRHTLHVVALRQYPEPCTYPLLGATIHNLGVEGTPLGLRFWAHWRALMAILHAAGPFDLVHGFWAGTPGLLAVLAARRLNVSAVVSVGGGELVWLPPIGYGGQGSWNKRIKVELSLRMAQAVTAGSQYAMTPLAARGLRAEWLPLGVDTRTYDALPERPHALPWRLLHVATHNRVKDQATLLRALRLVVDREPSTQLDWVGMDILDGAMQALASSLDLTHAVRFHGEMTSDQIVPLYRQSHLYLQSSLHESQGVAVCEAAAAGVPTVGTAVGLVPELAPNAAVAVPVGDADALAAGIQTLLSDPRRREDMGRAAQAWARTHSADWTAAQFESLYCRLL